MWRSWLFPWSAGWFQTKASFNIASHIIDCSGVNLCFEKKYRDMAAVADKADSIAHLPPNLDYAHWPQYLAGMHFDKTAN